MTQNNTRLVYTTESGRICPECGETQLRCACKGHGEKPGSRAGRGKDKRVRVRKETKGRKGKCVSIVSGLDDEAKTLDRIAKALKNLCGTGGTVKAGDILIQGDHRDKITTELKKLGYKVQQSGG